MSYFCFNLICWVLISLGSRHVCFPLTAESGFSAFRWLSTVIPLLPHVSVPLPEHRPTRLSNGNGGLSSSASLTQTQSRVTRLYLLCALQGSLPHWGRDLHRRGEQNKEKKPSMAWNCWETTQSRLAVIRIRTAATEWNARRGRRLVLTMPAGALGKHSYFRRGGGGGYLFKILYHCAIGWGIFLSEFQNECL